MKPQANQRIEPPGGSRSAQAAFVSPTRLVHTAALSRSGSMLAVRSGVRRLRCINFKTSTREQ